MIARADFKGSTPVSTATLTGQLSSDGNVLVNGVQTWTSHFTGSNPIKAAWGPALESLPGRSPAAPSINSAWYGVAALLAIAAIGAITSDPDSDASAEAKRKRDADAEMQRILSSQRANEYRDRRSSPR